MTQGFGKKPSYEREIRLMTKAVQSHNMPQLEALIRKFGQTIGNEKAVEVLTEQVLTEVNQEDSSWCWLQILGPERYEEMLNRSMDAMVNSLIDDGMEPGQDFSFATGTDGSRCLVMSDKAKETIISRIPAEHHERVNHLLHDETVQLGNPNLSAAEAIEQMLGVPFFDNLKAIATKRLEELSDCQAATYLITIGAGVESRHPELDGFFPWLLANTLPKSRRAAVVAIMQSEEGWESTPYFLSDLILAAGGRIDHYSEQSGEPMLSKNDLLLLAKVFQGERRVEDILLSINRK